MESESGVYSIRCLTNGLVYVGSSKNIKRRWSAHVSDLRKGKHSSSFLQRAWDKYGRDVFLFETVEVVDTHLLVEREQFWIDRLQAADRAHGFNLAPTAQSLRGHIHTAEARARMAASKRGLKYRPRSPEHLAALSRSGQGRKASQETRALLSLLRKEKQQPRSPEHSFAISRSLKGRPVSPGSLAANIGKKHSAETRAKMSAAHTGIKRVSRSASGQLTLSF